MEPGFEISLNTRIDFSKLLGNINIYWSSFQGWMLGSAYYINIRELPRDVFYDSDKKIIDEFLLQEHAVLLAIARRVTDKFALGVTGKLQIQEIEIPSHIHRTDTYGYYYNPAEEVLISQNDTLITDSETRTAFDVDMSSTFDISPRLRIGATLLNIVGSRLIETDTLSNRGFGVGTTFFFEQVQLGADLEFTERMGLNGSVGVSYVPCENLEFACGFMSRNLAIQTMVKYRSLLITYQYSQRGHIFTVSSVLRLPT